MMSTAANNASTANVPSVKIDLGYALITLGTSTIWTVLGGWLLYFYVPPEGTPRVPVALYGIALFLVRPITALVTLPIGYLSDRTNTRWGRRIPWMFLSGLPLLGAFFLFWTPPVAGESIWNLIYLVAILIIYHVAYTSNQVPYRALLPQLATLERHQVRVSMWTSILLLIGMVVGGLAGPLIEELGYAGAALVYAGAMLPCFYLPFAVLSETPGQSTSVAQLDLRQAAGAMLHNKRFVVMTITGGFYWGITALVQATIPYIVTEICLLDEADTWYFYLAAVIASLVSYPLVSQASGRWGKYRVFAVSLLASALSTPTLLLIGDWLPLPLGVQGVVWLVLQAVAVSGVVILPPAFGAEIIEHDEALTGRRREGVYYAVWGILDQLVDGIVTASLPLFLLLGRSHRDPQGPVGVKVITLVGGALLLIGFFVFLQYPEKSRPSVVEAKEVQA